MRFSTQTLVALLASPLMVLGASTDNPFNVPSAGITATAGKTTTLTWNPTTSGTVSLLLRSGASSDLNSGTTIASNIQNSGSYTWTVPSDITRGSDYAVEIVDDSDSSKTNYTPYFVIESTNTVASSTGASSSASASSSRSASGSSSASSASSSASGSASSSASSASKSASSASGSASSSASSASGSASSSMSTASRASSSSASRASSSSTAATSTGMAAASAIPLGLLALGALAL